MKHISVRGLKNGSIRKMFELAMMEYAKYLKCDRLHLDIVLKFITDTKGFDGECEIAEDVPSPRSFIIYIDKDLNLGQQLETLAHEMVHVRQYARNEMFDVSSTATRWKKRDVNIIKTDYKNHPWEKEANALMKKMTKRFLSNNQFKIKV